MNQGLLPKRYAKALFKYSAEKNVTADVYAFMRHIADAALHTPGLSSTLANPFVSDEQKQMLALTAAGANADKCHALTDFISLLIKNQRIDMLLEVALAFSKLYRKENNIFSVCIESASELSDDDSKRICALVQRHLNGATAEFSFVIDPALIGGFVVNIENERLDASVKNELEQLRLKLIK